WSVPTDSRASLLYVDHHLIALFEHGQLQLMKPNPDKYEVVSEVDLRRQELASLPPGSPRPLPADPYWAAPILSHGLLYIRGNNEIVCLEVIPDGATRNPGPTPAETTTDAAGARAAEN
ncbi:MAG: hypothetical protein AB7O38_15525, partial [Pirellulaceae bacterium]